MDVLITTLIGFVGLTTLYSVIIFIVYIVSALRAFKNYKPSPILKDDISNESKVTIVIPAYNEEVVINQTIESILKQDFQNFDIVVVNDGSTDNTVKTIVDKFNLKKSNQSYLKKINEKVNTFSNKMDISPIENIYKSSDSKIVVIDKLNGGKSTALNVGSIYSDSDWVLNIDADTLLSIDAISTVLKKKRDDVDAVSCMIGILNGNEIVDEQIVNPTIPKKILPRIQWLEYLRSFVLWRTANDESNATLVISGAFGFIKRAKILEIGGYKKDFLGEDMELTMNIHAHNGKIQFLSEILAWSEVPEDLDSLGKQRIRWYRGGLQSLIHYRNMLLNKKDNKFLGFFLIPFLWFADVFGPWVELFGWVLILFHIGIGTVINLKLYLLLYLLITILHWISMSLVIGFAYSKLDKNVAADKMYRIIPVIIFETVSYHFIHFFWMIKSHTLHYLGFKKRWNKFKRIGHISK